MKIPRSEIMKKILLTLDKQPSSIYDIQYSISDLSDPRRTRLPKLLKSMEDDGLVKGALQPGPLGPYRRMYELGPNAQDYLSDSLKDAIETILAFYNINKRRNSVTEIRANEGLDRELNSGSILFAAYPQFTIDDLEEIRTVLTSRYTISLAIVGKDEILRKTGITYQHLGHDVHEIKIESKSIDEMRLRGVPSPHNLSEIIAECKRVLVRDGIFRLTVPFTFSEESERGKLEDFIRSIVKSQFQELGLLEAKVVRKAMESNFSKTGTYETPIGEIAFWGIKS